MKRTKSMVTGLIAAIVMSLVSAFPPVKCQTTEIYVLPENNIFYTSQTPLLSKFNVTVWVSDVSDLRAYQICAKVNDTVLNIAHAWTPTWSSQWVFSGIGGVSQGPVFYDDDQDGSNEFVWTGAAAESPFDGTGLLTVIEFQIIKEPEAGKKLTSVLNINVFEPFETYLLDSSIDEIPATITNGYFEYNAPLHDVAIIRLIPSHPHAIGGETISINVSAKNNGGYAETFNVTAYADRNASIVGDEIVIGIQTLLLDSAQSTNITYHWNTSEVVYSLYTMSAHASNVAGENDTANNLLIDGTVSVLPLIHDVATTGVTFSPDIAYAGDTVGIYADVKNLGTVTEVFNVTTYADLNATVIGDETHIGNATVSLAYQGTSTLSFEWNTTGASSGNYTISAVAASVPNDANISDNIWVDGKVRIFTSVPCDDINITSPTHVELNPPIFQFNWTVAALESSLGNMIINSTGYEGNLRVVGSSNGSVHLRVNQPDQEFAEFHLPQSGSIQIPLWLLFEPGTYSGTYEVQLIVCGAHRLKITIDIIHIWVCKNGCYSVAGGTATFNWTVTGGSWAYLEAQPNMPSGWSFTVDPPVGTLFWTPHQIIVNITTAPDAQEGDIGYVTLRAYKNGTNTFIWQYTYFASVDSNPPTIETVQQPTLTTDGDLLFNTTVKDVSGIESVQLYYRVSGGPWNNKTMQSAAGDTFNSTQYTTTLADVSDNSALDYYVVATDWLKTQTQSQTYSITITYDTAVSAITSSKTVLSQGVLLKTNVTITNKGTIPYPDIRVTLYANTTAIDTQTIPWLINGMSMKLTFNWNTTELNKGKYAITAFVTPILGETSLTENILSTTIHIAMKGDVSGKGTFPNTLPDGRVDIKDFAVMALVYGVNYPDPRYVANYDIDGNGRIEIKDFSAAAKNYGKTDP